MTKKELLKFCKKVLNKNKLILKISSGLVPFSTISIFIFTVIYLNTRSYGLALSYKGQEIATIKSEETLEQASQMMKQVVSLPSGESGCVIPTPEYKLKVVDENICSSACEIKNKIIAKSEDETIDAAGIYSNGKLVSVVGVDCDVEAFLNSALENAKLGDKNAKTRFVENIEIIKGLYPAKDIKNIETLKDVISNGICSQIEYEIKQDETLESIANDFEVTLEELISTNNIKDFEIKQGDKLLIRTKEFPINIETEKIEDVSEDIPYETVQEADNSQYEGWERKDIEGKKGKKTSVNRVFYVNGREITRENISTVTVEEPITEHIYFGTKKKPVPTNNSNNTKNKNGKLMWPVPYTRNITSKFGAVDGLYRSSPHSGIDISSSGIHGKDIVAADDGIVEFAGSGGGYGNLVKISHQNGMQTFYGHCESLYVKSGQKVSAGERIASVGKTGNSTGYHVHFEVRINGKPQDPLGYLIDFKQSSLCCS